MSQKKYDELMIEKIKTDSVQSIAEELGLEEMYVRGRLMKLGVTSIAKHRGEIPLGVFARKIHTSPELIRRLVKEKNLPVRNTPPIIERGGSKKYLYIHPDDFWEWFKTNFTELNIKRLAMCELDSIPTWLPAMAKRSRDRLNERRAWTEEEDEYLLEMLSSSTVESIANHLSRTYPSVLKRMERLEIGNVTAYRGSFSTADIGRVFGVSTETVSRWARSGELKSYQVYSQRKDTRKKSVSTRKYSIYPEDLWDFLEKNKDKIDMTQYKRGVILPEPEWLDELENVIPKRKEWSMREEREVIRLILDEGKAYKDVGKELNRTTLSVKHKIQRLRAEGKFPRRIPR